MFLIPTFFKDIIKSKNINIDAEVFYDINTNEFQINSVLKLDNKSIQLCCPNIQATEDVLRDLENSVFDNILQTLEDEIYDDLAGTEDLVVNDINLTDACIDKLRNASNNFIALNFDFKKGFLPLDINLVTLIDVKLISNTYFDIDITTKVEGFETESFRFQINLLDINSAKNINEFKELIRLKAKEEIGNFSKSNSKFFKLIYNNFDKNAFVILNNFNPYFIDDRCYFRKIPSLNPKPSKKFSVVKAFARELIVDDICKIGIKISLTNKKTRIREFEEIIIDKESLNYTNIQSLVISIQNACKTELFSYAINIQDSDFILNIVDFNHEIITSKTPSFYVINKQFFEIADYQNSAEKDMLDKAYDEKLKRHFSDKFYKALDTCNLTIDQVAEILGISTSAVKQYAYGQKLPSFGKLMAIHKVLGLDMKELFDEFNL